MAALLKTDTRLAIADPPLFLAEFGHGGARERLVNALISGFAPYLTVRAFNACLASSRVSASPLPGNPASTLKPPCATP